ncbi:hypothetical protein ABID00_001956 [Faecalicatena orotica]
MKKTRLMILSIGFLNLSLKKYMKELCRRNEELFK